VPLSGGPEKKDAPRVIHSAGAATRADLLFPTPGYQTQSKQLYKLVADPVSCGNGRGGAAAANSLVDACYQI
jgi:hypothetical protein